jgi:predicted NBD/HSP70 family sugar kinase
MTEAVTSAGGIAWAARKAGLTFGSVKEIFAAAAAGDPVALAVVEGEGRRIGALLIAVAAVLDPELVVVAGGIGRNLAMLGDAIARRIEELGPLRPSIVASTLGDSGVLHGAVAHALDVARDRLFTGRSRTGMP